MEILAKIRAVIIGENFILFAIVVLCSVCSFGLGRLSVKTENKEPVQYIPAGTSATSSRDKTSSTGDKMPATVAKATVEQTAVAGQVIASKNGKNYYFESCSGAKRISEKNKITFASAEEAEKAGYTISASCDVP